MNTTTPFPAAPVRMLATGQPRFGSRVAEGTEAAWASLLAGPSPQQALRDVRGPFAVGWRRPDGSTLLAVDRFATQTLCYTVEGDRLRFASRADALVGPKADLDPQAVFDYLYFHAIPSPRTIFKGVHRLPPGHCAEFRNGRLTVAPYWTPTFTEPQHADFPTLREEFHHLLRAAVRQRVGAGKPGCFLSGGTDSSTVAGLLGEATGRRVATYSIGFATPGYDERAFARIAARRFGTEHHEYGMTPEDLMHSIATVARHYDQPFGNSSALPAYCCARMAREDGITRLMAGDGGDELFGGNARYAKQRVLSWYADVPAPVRRVLLEPLFENTPVGRLPLLRKGASYIRKAKTPLPARLQMYNPLLRLGVRDVLTPQFLAQVEEQGPARQQQGVWDAAQADSEINRTLAFDWRYTLAENDLPKVCCTAALAGVEVAFPLLDEDLVDFSLRLPARYKLNGLKLRWFFKEALRGFLPDEIIAKKKQGFGLPFRVWVTRHAGLRALVTESLRSLATRGIVRPDFMRSLVEQRLQEPPGDHGDMAWVLMMLEQWLQGHAEGTRM